MPISRRPKDGKDGLPGKQGERGPAGPPGKDGKDGRNGRDGLDGHNGKDGARGPRGETGKRGPRGERGERGPAGRNGFGRGGGASDTDNLQEGSTNRYFTEQRVYDSLLAGTNVTLSYDPVTKKTTISATPGDLTESVEDIVATLLQAGTGISLDYNDGANTLTIASAITQYTDEMAQDAVGAMVGGSLTYVDGTPLLDTIQGIRTVDTPTFAGIISSGANGLDANPGSDMDTDIVTIGVTGSPRMFWDESEDNFALTKGLQLPSGGNIKDGTSNTKRTIILMAAGGKGTTTSGCGGPTQVEAATNDNNYWCLEFDTTTEESAFWNAQMPDNWDGSTITARFIWTNAGGASTQTVVWGIKARAYADDDAIDQAFGTEVTVTDTWLAQNDVHISAASSAITVGGSPAGGRFVVFNVARKTGSDNMAGDARLIAVQIEYGINAYSD